MLYYRLFTVLSYLPLWMACVWGWTARNPSTYRREVPPSSFQAGGRSGEVPLREPPLFLWKNREIFGLRYGGVKGENVGICFYPLLVIVVLQVIFKKSNERDWDVHQVGCSALGKRTPP